MAQRALVIVDVQNDFVSGALGSDEARAMLPRLLDKARSFQGRLVFTMDSHGKDYLSTQEGRLLPVPHCLRGGEGWRLVPELNEFARDHGSHIFQKDSFGSVDLASAVADWARRGEIDGVELVGLCTDICVVSNALLIKAFSPELEVRVDASCCAGVTPLRHLQALEVMKSCQVLVDNEG